MNKLIISGRLTRDCVKRVTATGTSVLGFSVANNTGWGDKQKTHFFECSLWGKRAESKVAGFLLKGQQVIVEGEISLNTYQKKDGSMGAGLNMFVNDVELTGGKTEARPQASQQSPNDSAGFAKVDDSMDDDLNLSSEIPF